MAICSKCSQEKGCPCGWGLRSDGVKVCPSCVQGSVVQQSTSQPSANNIPAGIQIQSITYQHNHTG